MSSPPDWREREEALHPAKSFIVEAPAGSGKTSILVQRYLRLLSLVERPEAVVAMTFTRKAAAEMRDRVLSALAPPEPVLPFDEHQRTTRELGEAVLHRDREKGWNLLSDTGRLQIQTIDSLCSSLTRQMPVASHLGGTPEVVEHAEELYRMAARETLKTLAEGDRADKDLFGRVTLHFENNLGLLEGQMARMLERREQWRAFGSSAHSESVQDFYQLLRHSELQLYRIFRAAGKVDFPAITRAAISALGTPEVPSDLLYWLDYRIQHFLVDEFQDTSHSQYELIRALTEQWSDGDGRTLFLVGDPMQSIYRFREAEVGLFLQSWETCSLGSVRLVPLRLHANFRSTPEIVEWIGKTFSPIMPEDNKKDGAVKLRPASAVHPLSGVNPQLFPLVNSGGGIEEAEQVVQLVKAARPQGDVAILVRSRSQLLPILPALRQAGIDYEAIDIEQLRDQQHILDVLSLTRAIVHLGDRLSWLACLRAPWCGLTLADLAALAEREDGAVILDLLSRPEKIAALSVAGRERAVRLTEILVKAVATVGRVPLRELLEQTWILLGGPAVLTASQLEDVQIFFELIARHEEGGIIRDFSLLDERLEFLFARPVTGPNCVKIMTVHTAKGLEFDTVILPRLGAKTRSNEKDLLIWTEGVREDGESDFLVAAQPRKGQHDLEYDTVSEALNRREQHELKRLFYVAATRAKRQLYLIGSAEPNKDCTDVNKASKNTFLGLIWDSVQEEFRSELRRTHWHQGQLFKDGPKPVNTLGRLPSRWRLPKFDKSVKWTPELQRATASARRISFEWVSDTGRHVGSLVHELLKRVAQDGVDEWTKERTSSLKPLVSSELLRLGVAKTDEPAACAQVLRALSNTLGSERGRWILRKRSEAYSEWAIGGRVGRRLINGTVDRAFRDEQGRLWVIDFKTSEHEGSRLEAFLAEQQQRYRSQLESYAALLSSMKPGPIVLGLYFPLLDAWREWEYSEAVLTAH